MIRLDATAKAGQVSAGLHSALLEFWTSGTKHKFDLALLITLCDLNSTSKRFCLHFVHCPKIDVRARDYSRGWTSKGCLTLRTVGILDIRYPT